MGWMRERTKHDVFDPPPIKIRVDVREFPVCIRFSRNCKCLEFVSFLGNSMWIHTIRYSKYYPGKFGTIFHQPQQQTNSERGEKSLTTFTMHSIFLGWKKLHRTPVALVMKLIIIICGEISKLWRGVLHYVSLEVQEPAMRFCSALFVDPKNPLFFLWLKTSLCVINTSRDFWF